VLADIATAAWLPAENREPVLLRELEIDRIASAQAKDNNDYAVNQVVQLEKSLVSYYVGQKEDAKAEAMLQQLTEEQRKDGPMLMAQVELAARGHRLEALLASYRAEAENDLPAADLQSLRNAAASLARAGDKADALALWEFVFERLQLVHGLMDSDFMGLAAARLGVGNVSGAVEVLRRMTLLPADSGKEGMREGMGDGMAHYDEAARLLQEKGHDGEAIEFLSALAKGVPWNAEYRLRLATAQLGTGGDKGQSMATLAAIAGDSTASYELRVRAALAMRGGGGDTARLGSEELRLLASDKITLQQAQQPYFFGARVAAANGASDQARRAELLREAVAVAPVGLAAVEGFTGGELRLRIARAEAALGENAVALDAVQSLLNGSWGSGANASTVPAQEAFEGNARASNGYTGTDAASDDATAGLEGADAVLAELEGNAPLPLHGEQTDGAKLAVAKLIAQVYEGNGIQGLALPYFKLAAYLEKDPKHHAELEGHAEAITRALALEAENAARRPRIQKALDQAVVVRPRLDEAGLARMEAQ
jgi:hypothetical protein